jgi:hypothetical protein
VWRHWRHVVVLPDRIVFKADDDAAWRRLELEADVIARFRANAGPCFPAVTVRDAGTRTQERERLHGLVGDDVELLVFGTAVDRSAIDRYAETCPLTEAGALLATDLGRTLARMHRALTVPDALALGVVRRPSKLGDGTAEILRAHTRSSLLRRALASARAWLDARTADEVVVHGDPHLHNLAVDPATGALRGIFDFDEIAVGDRAQDLSYLHSSGLRFARAALRAYAAAGTPVDEDLVGRYHVVQALDHFNFVSPGAERFPRVVDWAERAAIALAPDWC